MHSAAFIRIILSILLVVLLGILFRSSSPVLNRLTSQYQETKNSDASVDIIWNIQQSNQQNFQRLYDLNRECEHSRIDLSTSSFSASWPCLWGMEEITTSNEESSVQWGCGIAYLQAHANEDCVVYLFRSQHEGRYIVSKLRISELLSECEVHVFKSDAADKDIFIDSDGGRMAIHRWDGGESLSNIMDRLGHSHLDILGVNIEREQIPVFFGLSSERKWSSIGQINLKIENPVPQSVIKYLEDQSLRIYNVGNNPHEMTFAFIQKEWSPKNRQYIGQRSMTGPTGHSETMTVLEVESDAAVQEVPPQKLQPIDLNEVMPHRIHKSEDWIDSTVPHARISDIQSLLRVSPSDYHVSAERNNKGRILKYIPKQIWQCYKGHFQDLGPSTLERVKPGIESHRAKGYDYDYFDDDHIIEFMLIHYGTDSRNDSLDTHSTSTPEFKDRLFCAFSMLRSGVAIADLWRYVMLRRFGGIYLDIDAVFKNQSNTFDDILTENDEFLLVYEPGNHGGAVQNFLATKAYHPFIHHALLVAVDNILNHHFYESFAYRGWRPMAVSHWRTEEDGDQVHEDLLTACHLKQHLRSRNIGGQSLKFAIGELTGPSILQIGIENAIKATAHCEDIERIHFIWSLHDLNNKFKGFTDQSHQDHWIREENRNPSIIFDEDQKCFLHFASSANLELAVD